jgi:hypothetical protein
MIRGMTVAVTFGAGLLLAGCTPPKPSLDQTQCLSADWTAQGYSDAAAGRGSARLDDHVKACAEHGITPDADAYHAGHIQGRRVWCRPANGFAMGRRGGRYNPSYCAPDLEPAFMQAVADGREVHAARSHAERLQVRVIEAQGQADSLASQIRTEENALAAQGLTDEQRGAIRQRIRNLRLDRDRYLDEVPRLQAEADVARRDADVVANRFVATYGG